MRCSRLGASCVSIYDVLNEYHLQSALRPFLLEDKDIKGSCKLNQTIGDFVREVDLTVGFCTSGIGAVRSWFSGWNGESMLPVMRYYIYEL